MMAVSCSGVPHNSSFSFRRRGRNFDAVKAHGLQAGRDRDDRACWLLYRGCGGGTATGARQQRRCEDDGYDDGDRSEDGRPFAASAIE